MFGIFKKKQQEYRMTAAADGAVVSMTEAQDPVFSSCALGNGVVIRPSGGVVVAPADGKVTATIRFDREALEAKGYCMEVMQIVMDGETASRVQYMTGMPAKAGETEVAHWLSS